MSKTLCIYHGNCADGFGAAWAVRHALGAANVEFHAGQYGISPPDVTGRDVLLVDFSYKRAVLDEMIAASDCLLILDHHKTAAEDLAGIPHVGSWAAWRETADQKVGALFDMNRSGAGIAWDFFHPDTPRPSLINRIEDRDLWRFQYEDTRAVQAAVFSYPYDFDVWNRLFETPMETLATEGAAIERKHHKDIAELVAASKRRMKIGGHDVPVANLPYTLSSDAGNLMAQGEPFAACYIDTPHGRSFSLRSTATGLDVSEIAKAYGGGGHRNASGFRMPIGWEGDAA